MQHENSQRTKRQERTFHSQRPHAPPAMRGQPSQGTGWQS